MTMASMDEVLAAIEAMDMERGWKEVAPSVLPVLQRRRAMPAGTDDRLMRPYPPGIPVGFGVDIGPAFLHVSDTMLATWSITADELANRALANVRAKAAARKHFGIITEPMVGVPTQSFMSRDGWASTLLLMPDEFERCFGPEPRLVLTPMRDFMLTLPLDSDRELASWMLEELVAEDPNGLDVPILAFVGGRFGFLGPSGPPVSPLERSRRSAEPRRSR
ncbi:MAG: hypothetical protein ABIZ34_05340 [Candidatus Limnocylindrales bacterium]